MLNDTLGVVDIETNRGSLRQFEVLVRHSVSARNPSDAARIGAKLASLHEGSDSLVVEVVEPLVTDGFLIETTHGYLVTGQGEVLALDGDGLLPSDDRAVSTRGSMWDPEDSL